MRVTRSDALAFPLRVAAFHSIYDLTDFPWTALGFLARYHTILSTDALLHTLSFRVEDLSFFVVVTTVWAATVSHRHAGIPTQQVAVVTLTGFCAMPVTGGMGG